MRNIKTNLPVRQAGMRNTAILFFSLFLTLAVFSQINAANPKPTYDVGLNKADWLYYKSNNDIIAYLGKKSSNLPTVRYQKDGDYLEFSMTGVSSTTSVALETNTKTPNTPTLFYRNILDGVDANYQITNVPFKIKEEIVLKHPPAALERSYGGSASGGNNPSFLFSAETTGKPVKQKDGSIAFFGENGEYLFQLDKPFMVDAKDNRSESVSLDIKPIKVPKTKNTSEEMFFGDSNLEWKRGLPPDTNQYIGAKNFVNTLNKYIADIKNVLDLGGIEPPKSLVANRSPHQVRPRTGLVYHKDNYQLSILNFQSRLNDLIFKLFSSLKISNWKFIENWPLKIENSKPQSYQIILSADSKWLSTATYPVIIDPTVTHNADANFTGQFNRIADSDTTSSTQLESSYPEATKDPHTVLLLHFNEANGTTAGIRDYASTTRVITANGNASTTNSVTQLGLGNSAAFDGTGDYLDIPDSDDWDFTNSDVTIDFWIKYNSLGSDTVHIITQTLANGIEANWALYNDLGKLSIGQVGVNGAQTADTVLFTGIWQHVAVVKNSGTTKIYVDSVEKLSTTISWAHASANSLKIGGTIWNTNNRFFNGYLDELRVIKGRALTPEEIKAAASRRPYAVYTSPVVDATASAQWDTINWTEGGVNTGNGEQPYNTNSLVAQWDFNDTSGTTLTASSSGSCTTACNGTLTNFAYTASQDQATTTTGWTANNKKWGAGALMMESAASADYVSITDPASNALDPGTGDFSVEGWIKSSATGQDTIIQNNTTVGACASNAGYVLIVNGNRNLAAYASDGTTCYVNNLTANASSTEIADGRWHHFAFVADRDTKAYVYYDGRLATSTTISNTTAANPAATIYFGASGATGDSDFILDSARYYSRALSSAEVLSNYQAGNIEIQTRTGATSDPNDGTWEAWKPTTGETQLLSMDSDAANWRSDIMASTTIATSTETVIKAEGTGSLKIRTGMASTTANTVALWHFEETGTTTGTYLYDETANNNDATTTGTTVVDGIFGKGRKFNGTSDYVEVSNEANFDLLGKFTLSAWIKLSYTDANSKFIISKYCDASCSDLAYRFQVNGSNQLEVFVSAANGSNYILKNTTQTLIPNQWYYAVGTYDGGTTASAFKLYLNGLEITNVGTGGNGTYTGMSNIAQPLRIGAAKSGTSIAYYFPGTIDEPVVSTRIFSPDEIAETYRMGANHHLTRQVSAVDLSGANKLAFNVASDRPGTYLEAMIGESDYANYELASSTLALSTTTVLYIKGDEIASSTSIKDSSFSGKAITVNGNARTSGNGKIGNAMYFDGSGDYLTVPDSADWDFGSGDFSVSYWTWRVGSGSDNGPGSLVIGREEGVTYTAWQIGSGNDVNLSSSGSSWIDCPLGYNSAISWQKWHNVVLTRSGTTFTVFVDGVRVASCSSSDSLIDSSNPLSIGKVQSVTYANGYMDEIRILKGTALTADQIRQAYEYGLRSHQITIDFGATLQTSDLISNSTDYNFNITATTSGLSATTSGLYLGDKIIIKENLGGTEYSAQGTVNAINTTTGAITVPSWDTGSTFPASNGYSPNATVFKWQREYFDLTGAATTTRNAITNLTLRPTNNAGGRTIYLDDFRYNTNYLTASSSSAITSGNNRYLQYRAIFTSTDTYVSPFLSAFNTLYTALANSFPSLIGVSGGGFLSF